MNLFAKSNTALAKRFIEDFDHTGNSAVRIQHGLLAGWTSILIVGLLFLFRLTLGIISDSVAVIADALNLINYFFSAAVVVFSFWMASRPATSRTPFGQGRMEYVAPLLVSVLLLLSGLQIGRESRDQIVNPEAVFYWSALPWMLFFTMTVKWWLSQFVSFLGRRVNSRAILAIVVRNRIDSYVTLFVIGGLLAGHYLERPELDGYIGMVAAGGLFYLAYHEGREAIIPILGKAPDMNLIGEIRRNARMVDGIEDVHEIILHDYGDKYIVTLHAEIHEKNGPAGMHEIAERCERSLREIYGGEVVCHTDPLLEKTPEFEALEAGFRGIVNGFPEIRNYHDFRIVTESDTRRIFLADIVVHEAVPEREFGRIASTLEAKIKETVPNVTYCCFHITPKFAY